MRETKFEAWQERTKTMYKWPDVLCHYSANSLFLEADKFGLQLRQYTGLRDKNGKEIYEGDNIKFTYWWFDGNEAESTLEGTVVYTPETMSYSIEGIKNAEWLRHIGGEENNEPDTSPFALFQFEEADFLVTGNIYENGKA